MRTAMEAKRKTRILLADDHFVVRSGLASILSFEDDLEVVGGLARSYAS